MHYNNRLQFVSCLLLAILMFADTLSVAAETPSEVTYRNYPEWYLLPKSFDLEDENVLAAFQRLVDEGEAAHEAMVAIAKECEESMVASYALSVLRESSGDKREAVAELKQFFAARFPHAEGEEEWRMTFIAETLADIGTEDDVAVLAPMLAHPNMQVRYLGAQYLGQRGGQQAMEALERAKSRESNNLVLDEMNKAVASISSRLAEQDAEAKAKEEMTVSEVLALLPHGPDVDDDLEIANYEKLVARGQSIYGVLLEIVRTHPDTRVASAALSALCDAQGDKREVVAELGRVLEEKQSITGSKNEVMLMALAKAILDMGEASDKQLLQPLFSHPSEGVREVAGYFASRLEKKAANLATPSSEESDETPSDETTIGEESSPVP